MRSRSPASSACSTMSSARVTPGDPGASARASASRRCALGIVAAVIGLESLGHHGAELLVVELVAHAAVHLRRLGRVRIEPDRRRVVGVGEGQPPRLLVRTAGGQEPQELVERAGAAEPDRRRGVVGLDEHAPREGRRRRRGVSPVQRRLSLAPQTLERLALRRDELLERRLRLPVLPRRVGVTLVEERARSARVAAAAAEVKRSPPHVAAPMSSASRRATRYASRASSAAARSAAIRASSTGVATASGSWSGAGACWPAASGSSPTTSGGTGVSSGGADDDASRGRPRSPRTATAASSSTTGVTSSASCSGLRRSEGARRVLTAGGDGDRSWSERTEEGGVVGPAPASGTGRSGSTKRSSCSSRSSTPRMPAGRPSARSTTSWLSSAGKVRPACSRSGKSLSSRPSSGGRPPVRRRGEEAAEPGHVVTDRPRRVAGQEHPAVRFDEHVLGVDAPVLRAGLVQVRQRLDDRPNGLADPAVRHRADTRQRRRQQLAVAAVDRDDEQVVELVEIADPRQARMVDAPVMPDLALRGLEDRRARTEVDAQQLRGLEPAVVGQPEVRERVGAQDAPQHEAVQQQLALMEFGCRWIAVGHGRHRGLTRRRRSRGLPRRSPSPRGRSGEGAP